MIHSLAYFSTRKTPYNSGICKLQAFLARNSSQISIHQSDLPGISGNTLLSKAKIYELSRFSSPFVARYFTASMVFIGTGTIFLHKFIHIPLGELGDERVPSWLVEFHTKCHDINDKYIKAGKGLKSSLSDCLNYTLFGFSIFMLFAYGTFKITKRLAVKLNYIFPKHIVSNIGAEGQISEKQVSEALENVMMKRLNHKRIPDNMSKLCPYLPKNLHQQLVDSFYSGKMEFIFPNGKRQIAKIKDLRKTTSGVLRSQSLLRNIIHIPDSDTTEASCEPLKFDKTQMMFIDWDALEIQSPGIWYLIHSSIPWIRYPTTANN